MAVTYQDNVYYHPEDWGLTVVAEAEYSSQCYEFDTRVVWKDSLGILYTARSSGCSCPTPFEEFSSPADLERVDITDLRREVREESTGDYAQLSMADAQAFIRKVKRAYDNQPVRGGA